MLDARYEMRATNSFDRNFGGVRIDGLISYAFLCKYFWTIDFDNINIYLEFIDFLFPLLGQGYPEKEALAADRYEKKSLKNLSQVCSEAVNSEGTSEVAV